MPWNVKWLDENERVLIMTPTAPWEWGVMEDTFDTANALAGGKPYKVDLIVEFTGDLKPPQNPTGEHIAPFVPLRERLLDVPPNRGLMILVSAPLYVESIVRNLQSVVKEQVNTDHIKFADSLDEALAMIEKARQARDED